MDIVINFLLRSSLIKDVYLAIQFISHNLQTMQTLFNHFRNILLVHALVLLSYSMQAQDIMRIKNAGFDDTYINVETPYLDIASTPIEEGWWSAQWVLEKVAGTDFVRIKNRWKGTYINIEEGYLSCYATDAGWWSGHWKIEEVFADRFGVRVRIQNRWKPDQYLNMESGYLTCGTVDKESYSAQWYVDNAPVKHPLRKPTSSEGKAGYMLFRYGKGDKVVNYAATNQATIGQFLKASDVKVGSRIKIIPNQQISEAFLNEVLEVINPGVFSYGKTGISFDPKKPQLCGHTFTVNRIVDGVIYFNKPFPEKMYNDNNSYFNFQVVILN